ncbi:MAG TPA: myo-inosose-2 dehydratase [Caulobacteraceae bacterium]|nr:myo-inosose-2 dehydratase [Caulobacteraceae bacterium]
MTVRFGVSPIAWANDDMPELGGTTPLETILADARDLGFAGVELGGKFPRDARTLAPLLARYDLALVGGWHGGGLLARDVDAEIAAAQDHLDLLRALGVRVFIHAETSNAIHAAKGIPLSRSPRLDADGWARFGERVTRFADYIAAQGLAFAYHHHLGTVVERPEDLDAFIDATGPAVGLTLDTGHAALAGIDPVDVIRRYPERIAHMHCKDIRRSVFARGGDRSFLDGVLAGMFTAPGDGDVDFVATMRALAASGYKGWIVVEAEQDPAIADPRASSALGLRTLKAEAAAAGLDVEA